MRAKRLMAGMMGSVLVATTLAQPPRTPDGQLWAGTTLTLQAVATSASGQPLSLSNSAQVRVGQLVRWQWEHESPPYLTVPSGDGWLSVLVRNKGNGVDTLRLKTATSEGVGTTPWQINLYEQRDANDLFNEATAIGEEMSPFMPSESRRLFIQARPPSDRNTDGVFLTLKAMAVSNSQWLNSLEFVAGIEASVSAHTTASTWQNYPLACPPQLLNGRLFWLAASGSDIRLFSTPQPLSTNSTFQNNIRYEAKVTGLLPSGRGTVVGARWYLFNTLGAIACFDWTQATGGATVAVQWLPLNGLLANPNLPLLSDGSRLYFALPNQHIGVYELATNVARVVLFTRTSPIVQLQALPNGLVFVGRADGRFDLLYQGVALASGIATNGSAGVTGAALDERRGNVIIVSGSWVGCYSPLRNLWLWQSSLHAPVITAPAYDVRTECVYLLTQDGWLYALNASAGDLCPLYPQPILTGVALIKANIAVVNRSDRKVSYVYVAAQWAENGTPKTRVMFITASNPFNRFYSLDVVDGALLGDSLLFTGDTPDALCLVWCWSGNDPNRGRFYGFRLR